MKVKLETRNDLRIRRHKRLRARVLGTPSRPRLSVFRSLNYIYAQIIDDVSGKTLISLNERKLAAADQKGTKSARASLLGGMLSKIALEKGIKKVRFDRGGYKYHGRVKAFAESARQGGLIF